MLFWRLSFSAHSLLKSDLIDLIFEVVSFRITKSLSNVAVSYEPKFTGGMPLSLEQVAYLGFLVACISLGMSGWSFVYNLVWLYFFLCKIKSKSV